MTDSLINLTESLEGEAFDARGDMVEPEAAARRGRAYTIPSALPALVRPEITVSIAELAVRLDDPVSGFSKTYPAGLGKIVGGRSVTPVGVFATHDDPGHGWYFMESRWTPDYYAGFPFLRITAPNADGHHAYGFHGPITETLIRGYVSNGCVRMEKADIVELFWTVRRIASVPVAIAERFESGAIA